MLIHVNKAYYSVCFFIYTIYALRCEDARQ